MVAVIIGDGPMLDTLRKGIPEQRWRVPAGDDERDQMRYLADHPAPRGKGLVFTNRAGNWLNVSRAGWVILWCDDSPLPMGATALPEQALERSIRDLAKRYWGTDLADRRLVGEVLLGNTSRSATLLTVTSASGGVGKTLTSRRLCERASKIGIPTLLIDGNMLQSSQRSFFDPAKQLADVRTIADWRPGMRPQKGANQGKRFGVGYDICFAPPIGVAVPWDHYARYIAQARRLWGLIVLDLDRISAVDLDDDSTAAGALLAPSLLSGDPCLFIVKTGRQTQSDAMSVLSVMPDHGFPPECVGIKDSIPIGGQDDYEPVDYSGYGTFLGSEQQTKEAGDHVAAGQSNWDDPNLDMTRERVLEWAMPDEDFDPSLFEPKEGLLGGLFGGKKKRKSRRKPAGRNRDDRQDERRRKPAPQRDDRPRRRRRDEDDDYDYDGPDAEAYDEDEDERPRRRKPAPRRDGRDRDDANRRKPTAKRRPARRRRDDDYDDDYDDDGYDDAERDEDDGYGENAW